MPLEKGLISASSKPRGFNKKGLLPSGSQYIEVKVRIKS